MQDNDIVRVDVPAYLFDNGPLIYRIHDIDYIALGCGRVAYVLNSFPPLTQWATIVLPLTGHYACHTVGQPSPVDIMLSHFYVKTICAIGEICGSCRFFVVFVPVCLMPGILQRLGKPLVEGGDDKEG